MKEKTIKIARLRNIPYKVNYVGDGIKRTYVWSGSKNGVIDIKDIPEDVVNWLLMSTVCFKEGELKIVEDTPTAKEAVANIDGKEEYKENTHSREEIAKLLEGNTNTMKAELNKITNIAEKRFVCDVAKEIKLDVSSKRNFLANWIGVAEDILFAEDNNEK